MKFEIKNNYFSFAPYKIRLEQRPSIGEIRRFPKAVKLQLFDILQSGKQVQMVNNSPFWS